jgi:hypothetical protein
LDELWALGARAFSIGTLFLRAPLQPNRLIRAWRAQQHAHEQAVNQPKPL